MNSLQHVVITSRRSVANVFPRSGPAGRGTAQAVWVIDDAFRGTDATANGLVTRGVLRGPRFRRLLPDVYAPAALPPDLALRSRAAYLWASGRGVLTGWSAAELLSTWRAPDHAPAELTMLGRHPPAPGGLILRQDRLADDE